MTNVLVLDEHIQELSKIKYTLQRQGDTDNGKQMPIREIWDLMQVYIPSSDEHIDLGKKSYENDYVDRLEELIIREFHSNKRAKSGLDYIIIHIGVMEKLLKLKGQTTNEINLRKLAGEIRGKSPAKPEVIFTSGRAPVGLPTEYSFMSYSILSQYLIENRFKLHLNEGINSTKPKQ